MSDISKAEAHEIGDAHGDPEKTGAITAHGVGLPPVQVPCPPHTTERKLLMRIDYHLVPFVIVLYLCAFLDRVNIANARSFGLEADLGLHGTQFNTALTIFFVPYIVFEVASNIFMKRFTPRIWLSACCFLFGVVTVCQGLTQNFGGILATRFFLGLAETGLFPGCFYLLSCWYKRGESLTRFTLFFGSTSLAGAFSGLLASAIGKLDYAHGFRGWRWIFIIEGSVTAIVGLIFLFTFPAFPEQSKWVTEDERAYIKARLEADQGPSAAERPVSFRDVLVVLKDYKIWLGGFMYFGLIVPAYGYAYFSPTILATYNYGTIETQLHSVPPWVCAFGFSLIMAVISDKVGHRFGFIMLAICMPITGFAILLRVHNNVNAEYAALCLIAAGTYTAMPIIVCWFNMNLAGHRRRAIGSAWQVGFGNIGGIIATYSFVSTDAPLYTKGYAIGIGFVCLSALSCIAYAIAITRENKRRDKAVRDVGLTEYERMELGDLNPEYRYML